MGTESPWIGSDTTESEEFVDEEWDVGIEGSSFIKFPACIEFMTSNPLKTTNQYGKDCWRWDVIELDEEGHEIGPKILSTGSKRLRRVLKAHKPLLHQRLFITRHGEGMSIDYVAKKLDGSGNTQL